MPTRPEALRLADLLESCPLAVGDAQQAVAAAELRRLHAENEALQNTKHYEAPPGFVLNPDYLVPALRAQRDALLELLKLARSIIGHPDDAHTQMIDAVIKAVEEGK